MKIQQLSIFLENKPGHLSHVVSILAEKNFNIVTLSMADTEQFGILRLIVKEWEAARDALLSAGFIVKVTDVIAIEIADRPDGLGEILRAIERHGLNIEYMYAFSRRLAGAAVLLFRFSEPDAAVAALNLDEKINLLSTATIFA